VAGARQAKKVKRVWFREANVGQFSAACFVLHVSGMNADELQERTFQFALAVLLFVDAYPNTLQGRTVAGQLLRAATSVGANYRSTRRARTKREFAASLGVVKTEADEAEYWLALTLASEIVRDAERVKKLLQEATQLRAIFVASHATACERLRAARAAKLGPRGRA
jgi:four helix bundle protein